MALILFICISYISQPDKHGGDAQETVQSDVKERSRVRRAYDWFCGFDDSEEGMIKVI